MSFERFTNGRFDLFDFGSCWLFRHNAYQHGFINRIFGECWNDFRRDCSLFVIGSIRLDVTSNKLNSWLEGAYGGRWREEAMTQTITHRTVLLHAKMYGHGSVACVKERGREQRLQKREILIKEAWEEQRT